VLKSEEVSFDEVSGNRCTKVLAQVEDVLEAITVGSKKQNAGQFEWVDSPLVKVRWDSILIAFNSLTEAPFVFLASISLLRGILVSYSLNAP